MGLGDKNGDLRLGGYRGHDWNVSVLGIGTMDAWVGRKLGEGVGLMEEGLEFWVCYSQDRLWAR